MLVGTEGGKAAAAAAAASWGSGCRAASLQPTPISGVCPVFDQLKYVRDERAQSRFPEALP